MAWGNSGRENSDSTKSGMRRTAGYPRYVVATIYRHYPRNIVTYPRVSLSHLGYGDDQVGQVGCSHNASPWSGGGD